MNNFRRRKKHGHHRAANVDGIIVGNMAGSRHMNPVPIEKSGVADFKRPDGFHASQRGHIDFHSPSSSIGRQPNRGTDGTIALDMPPAARHTKHTKHSGGWFSRHKKLFLRSAIVVVIFVALVGGFVGWKFLNNTSKIFKGNLFGFFDKTKLKGEDTGRVNILLAGNSVDDPGHGGAELTDSVMLVSIDTVNNTGYMLSIPRDLWVNYGTRECSVGYQGKINAAYVCGKEIEFDEAGYPEGGMGLLSKVVERDFGVDVHYTVRINYTAFRDAVNAVGGIDVTIKSEDPRGLYDGNIQRAEGGPLKLANGKQHLNGQTALNLARARGDTISYGYSRGDHVRTEYQRQMLLALKDKALSAGVLSNPAKLGSLLDAAGNNIETDFKTNEVRRLHDISKKLSNNNIKSIGLADEDLKLVVGFAAPNGTSSIRPTAGLNDFSAIKAYIKRITTNDPVFKEHAKVVVLNGTTITGMALSKSNQLKSAGYDVIQTGDAPTKTYQQTVVVDLHPGTKKASKRNLEERFSTTATTTLPDPAISAGTADFVIILGQNASPTN